MKRIAQIIAIALLGAIAAPAQKSIKPATSYKQGGISIVSPNQPGWTLLKADKSETIFEKRSGNEILNASVKTIPTKTCATDKDRLVAWEALKNEEFSKLNRDSLHFYYTRFKSLMCLRYDGSFPKDKTPSNNFERFNIKGYLCPLPNNQQSAVQMEVFNYSNKKGMSEDMFALSEEFFDKVTFSSKK
jgi:hypothetical protein